MIDSIRLTHTEKELLIRVKRKTGIDSWNVLCRWALLIGLSQKEYSYRNNPEKRDAVEIKWDTFAGRNKDFYHAVIHVAFNKKAIHNESLMDFIYNQIESGIRILSTQSTEYKLLLFKKYL